MKLFAVLCWYDESPTWLASCVSSLSRIGVDHIIAVDGRYPHFSPGSPPSSWIEQSETILGTAAALDIGVTLHRPVEAVLMEPQKRELCHRLVGLTATAHDDWFIVIDGDEYVSDTTADLKPMLEALDENVYTVAVRVSNVIDPGADPGPDNDVNEKTAELYRKMPLDPRFSSMQSRVWRVLDDMRVGPAHYHYTGTNREGVRVYQRPDIGTPRELPGPHLSEHHIERVHAVTIMHRKNWRTHIRRTAKTEYYELRDRTGLERVAT